jgi:hypothetical protein
VLGYPDGRELWGTAVFEAEEIAMSAQERAASAAPPVSGHEVTLGTTLQPIIHVNAHFIRLAIELSYASERDGQSEGFARLGHLLRTCDTTALDRVSRCPFLLVEAGFRDPARWVAARLTPSGVSATVVPAHTSPNRLVSLARSTMLVAWHVIQSSPLDADLLLGATPDCASVLAGFSLPQMEELAEKHSDWVRPRWEQRLDRWQLLINIASTSPFTASAVARCALSLFRGELSATSAL